MSLAGAVRLKTSLEFPGSEASCAYAIEDEEKALARGEDPSIPGPYVNVTSLECGEVQQVATGGASPC